MGDIPYSQVAQWWFCSGQHHLALGLLAVLGEEAGTRIAVSQHCRASCGENPVKMGRAWQLGQQANAPHSPAHNDGEEGSNPTVPLLLF